MASQKPTEFLSPTLEKVSSSDARVVREKSTSRNLLFHDENPLLIPKSPSYGALTESETQSGGSSELREVLIPIQDGDAQITVEDWDDEKEETTRNTSNEFVLDRNALHFGVRMAVLMTVASLFVLVGGRDYPDGHWVVISVLFVSWFPNLDAASVIEKSVQRLIGTFLGVSIALLCGFSSLWVLELYGEDVQTAYLTCGIAMVTFGFAFLSSQIRVGNNNSTKLVQKFPYASILFLLTFYICILPFNVDEEPRWLISIVRVANVIIGCIIGALGSILVLPRSTSSLLKERIARQIKLAGESSEAVLHAAADAFSGQMRPVSLAIEMLESPGSRRWRLDESTQRKPLRFVNRKVVSEDGDAALDKYETAIQDWKVTKAVFSLLRYDPFQMLHPLEETTAFHEETANTLARALRLQTTVVLLDGIIRNDTKHNFTESDLTLFADIGSLIRKMFTVPFDKEASDAAAEELLEKLAQSRFSIVQSCAVIGRSSHELPSLDTLRYSSSHTRLNEMDSSNTNGRGMPKHVKGSGVCALLFQQLVEHLCLRALGLYRAWKQVEALRF